MPQYKEARIDTFLGASTDRSGVELLKNEFTAQTNYENNNLKGLKKRPGSTKVFSQTHTGSAAKVIGMFTYTVGGTETYIKVLADGKVYKSTGGAWSQITASAPTFTNADTFLASLNTKDTGAANTDSGTSEAGTANSLEDQDKTFTVNTFLEKVLTVNSEIKFISSNDATNIFVKERFDTTPSADAYTVNPRAVEFFIANGTDFYKCDGTTFTRLDNSNFAQAFTGITTHVGRLFGWKGTRLHYSDLGVGEHFSRDSFEDFASDIQVVKTFGDVLVVYEQEKVSVLRGDNPSNFRIEEVLDIGTTSPKTVANYHGLYQFFLSEEYGVIVLSKSELKSAGRGEPISVSDDYFNSDILGQSSANIKASCADVHKGQYHLCIDDDWYKLNIAASDKTGFRHWVWNKDDRPAAQDANVLGHYGTRFVAGAQDNGQVYHIENGAATDDDSTAIATSLEKQDWNPTGRRDNKHYARIKVSQATTTNTATMNYFADPEGSTYGSAIKSIDLKNAGTSEHDIPFTANASDVKNIGKKMSVKATESGSVAVSAIEEISMLYLPGIET